MPPLMVHSWILNFKVKFSHFHFFKVKITNFPSSKHLRLLVCYILHTSIQYCIKTISVAICLRYSDMMTWLKAWKSILQGYGKRYISSHAAMEMFSSFLSAILISWYTWRINWRHPNIDNTYKPIWEYMHMVLFFVRYGFLPARVT